MNKNELIAAVAEKANVAKKDADACIAALADVIRDTLVADDKVTINGIGTFETVVIKEKTGTIQMGARKGETYTTPEHRAPKFKTAKALKDAVAE